MLPRGTTPKLEMGVGEDPVMKDIGIRQLQEAGRRHLLSDLSRRTPGARLEHRVQMCELGTESSFTQHQKNLGITTNSAGEGDR
jgi:hypothetical protein